MPTEQEVISANELDAHVCAAAEYIAERWDHRPRVGVILGTGLGTIVDELDGAVRLSYADIPYFARSTAPGHHGHLSCGTMDGVPVLAMAGRAHVYEGTPSRQIALPVRVMQRLGIETLVVSNAAGGVNPNYRVGDLMAIVDHIDLMGAGPPFDEVDCSLRVPPVGDAYDPELIERALSIARRGDFVCHRGVYVALSGPNYETRAEYRMVRRIGGDVVGMSSVPEVVVARRLELRVLGLSIVTNVCLPDALAQTAGDDVAAAAAQAVDKLRIIIRGVVQDHSVGG